VEIASHTNKVVADVQLRCWRLSPICRRANVLCCVVRVCKNKTLLPLLSDHLYAFYTFCDRILDFSCSGLEVVTKLVRCYGLPITRNVWFEMKKKADNLGLYTGNIDL